MKISRALIKDIFLLAFQESGPYQECRRFRPSRSWSKHCQSTPQNTQCTLPLRTSSDWTHNPYQWPTNSATPPNAGINTDLRPAKTSTRSKSKPKAEDSSEFDTGLPPLPTQVSTGPVLNNNNIFPLLDPNKQLNSKAENNSGEDEISDIDEENDETWTTVRNHQNFKPKRPASHTSSEGRKTACKQCNQIWKLKPSTAKWYVNNGLCKPVRCQSCRDANERHAKPKLTPATPPTIIQYLPVSPSPSPPAANYTNAALRSVQDSPPLPNMQKPTTRTEERIVTAKPTEMEPTTATQAPVRFAEDTTSQLENQSEVATHSDTDGDSQSATSSKSPGLTVERPAHQPPTPKTTEHTEVNTENEYSNSISFASTARPKLEAWKLRDSRLTKRLEYVINHLDEDTFQEAWE